MSRSSTIHQGCCGAEKVFGMTVCKDDDCLGTHSINHLKDATNESAVCCLRCKPSGELNCIRLPAALLVRQKVNEADWMQLKTVISVRVITPKYQPHSVSMVVKSDPMTLVRTCSEQGEGKG